MVGSKKINLIIYTNEPIPIGMAATNRLLSYSKGLVELNHNVVVYSSKPGLNNEYNKINDNFEGVKYNILSNTKTWNDGKLIKLFLYIYSHFLFFFKLIESKKNNEKPIVLLISNKVFTIVTIRIFTWLLKLSLIQEKSEFPFQYLSKNWFIRVIYANIYSNLIYKLFDGMIVMTEPLVNFFKKRIRKSVPILHYPLTLDCKRFINADSSNEFNFKYIGYIGYMGGNKDGVLDLLKSFIIVNKSFKNIKLLLVGNANKLDIDVIKDFVIKNNLSEFVVFTGQVDRNKIPDILKSAEVLVLARPQSLQSLGGFPTKLGEYLSSGNPVVVTKVGDIPKFIIDKEHALLCVPGDIDDIAEKIINILSNPQFYRQMAIKGQKFAEEKFDYIKQAYTLEAFLSENFHE